MGEIFDKIVDHGERQLRQEQVGAEQFKRMIIDVTKWKDNPYAGLLAKEQALSLFDKNSDYDVAIADSYVDLIWHAKSCGWNMLESIWQVKQISWLMHLRSKGGWQQDEFVTGIQKSFVATDKKLEQQMQASQQQGGLQ